VSANCGKAICQIVIAIDPTARIKISFQIKQKSNFRIETKENPLESNEQNDVQRASTLPGRKDTSPFKQNQGLEV
jgi:hypothetical protein